MPQAMLTTRLLEKLETIEKNSQKHSKKTEILLRARKLLTEQGLESFSLRRVAEAAGIKLGSLQYHYATKSALMQALVERELDWYRTELLHVVAENNDSPKDTLVAVIQFLVEEAKKDARFDFQLWALAAYDSMARDALDQYLFLYREFLAELIADMNPDLSESTCWARAAIISTTLESTSLELSKGKPKHKHLEAMPDELCAAVLRLAAAPDS